MQSYLKFTKQVIIIGSIDLLKVLQTLLFLPVITKILGAQDYGIWSQLRITISLLVPFTFLGLHESLARFLPGAKDENEVKEGVYSSSFFVFSIALAIAFLLAVFSGPTSRFLGFDAIYVKLLSLLVVFESLSAILFTVVKSLREITKYFWIMVFRMFGETGLVILAVTFGYGLQGAVISFLAIRVATFFILVFYVIGKVGLKFPDFSIMRGYLKFGLPTIIDHFSYWAITSIDRYFIGFMLGIVFVGYYAPAYSIGMLLNLFLFPIAFMLSAVLPKFFDENNLQEVKKYLSYSLKYFLLMIIPAAFGLSALSKQLLSLFSTKEISEQAFLVVPFVAFSMLLYGVTSFFSQILILKKKTRIIALIWFAGAIVNFILNIFFIPKFGILGAAFTTLVAYLSAFLLMRRFAAREFDFYVDKLFIGKSLLASFLMFVFIFSVKPSGLPAVLAAVFVSALIYALLMFTTKAIGKKEVVFLKNLLLHLQGKA